MTACQRIKAEILRTALEDLLQENREELTGGELGLIESLQSGITAETVDEQYHQFLETDRYSDYESEFRGCGIETDIAPDTCRHYSSRSVATRLDDGVWVGWTYYYGGGKHGQPDEMEWMEDAYYLDVTETEKLVTVREFKKKS